MNFFNIGTAELLLIFVIALIVVGPRRLPEIARTLGKIANDIRKISQEFTTEMTRELNTVSNSKGDEGKSIADQNISDKPIQSLGQIVSDVRRLPQEFMGEITKELEAPVKELKEITREVSVSLDPKEPKENEGKEIVGQDSPRKPVQGDQA